MTNHAQVERRGLASLLLEVGPDAPTLCEGWTTRDLAAHLVLRESRPDAAVGIVLPPLAPRTQRLQRDLASGPWAGLVERVRSGPPAWVRPFDEAMNTVEYFVHHEDVRRATAGWEPRPLDPVEEDALWRRLRALARLNLRRAGVTVTLEAPGHAPLRAGRGEGEVRLVGPPSELVLVCFGRGAHSRAERHGAQAALDRLDAAKLGL